MAKAVKMVSIKSIKTKQFVGPHGGLVLFDVLRLIIEKFEMFSIPPNLDSNFLKTRYLTPYFKIKVLRSVTAAPYFSEFVIQVRPGIRPQLRKGRAAIKSAFSILTEGLTSGGIKASFCPHYSKSIELSKEYAHIVALQFFTIIQTDHARLDQMLGVQVRQPRASKIRDPVFFDPGFHRLFPDAEPGRRALCVAVRQDEGGPYQRPK